MIDIYELSAEHIEHAAKTYVLKTPTEFGTVKSDIMKAFTAGANLRQREIDDLKYIVEMQRVGTIRVGEFECISGVLRVSDPCYDTDTWCAGEIGNAKLGKWVAQVVKKPLFNWGNRIFSLVATHEHYVDCVTTKPIITKFVAGVDSGQMSIVDTKFYRDETVFTTPSEFYHGSNSDDINEWYGHCCDLTCETALSAGVIPYGCVSTSGLGDGSYECFYSVNEVGEVIRIEVVFIDNESDENEDDWGDNMESDRPFGE